MIGQASAAEAAVARSGRRYSEVDATELTVRADRS